MSSKFCFAFYEAVIGVEEKGYFKTAAALAVRPEDEATTATAAAAVATAATPTATTEVLHFQNQLLRPCPKRLRLQLRLDQRVYQC